MSDPLGLIRDLVHEYHQTGSIRDHIDRTDKTGWNVKGIETCSDPLCVEALAFLAAPRSVETPGLDVEAARVIVQWAIFGMRHSSANSDAERAAMHALITGRLERALSPDTTETS